MVALGRRPGSSLVIVGVSVVALALGLLLAAYHHFGFRLPEWMYLGLLWLGTVGGALANGYRDGGLAGSVSHAVGMPVEREYDALGTGISDRKRRGKESYMVV